MLVSIFAVARRRWVMFLVDRFLEFNLDQIECRQRVNMAIVTALLHIANILLQNLRGEREQTSFEWQTPSVWIEMGGVDDPFVKQLQHTQVRIEAVANENGVATDAFEQFPLHILQRGGHIIEVALSDARIDRVVIENGQIRLDQFIIDNFALQVNQRDTGQFEGSFGVALERNKQENGELKELFLCLRILPTDVSSTYHLTIERKDGHFVDVGFRRGGA